MATNKWHFPLLPLDADEDSSIVGDNFKRESKGFPGIFAREFLQNTLDARERKDNGSGELQTARVSIKFLSSSDINNNYLKDALSDLEPHLRGTQTSFQPLAFEEPNILVLEEFSTTGLTGAVNNSRAQGAEERYAAFFFGEGKVSKSGKSNGRAGQGKITYNLASAARTVLVHTIREGEKTGLLFGKAIFDRTHEIGGTWYLRKSYWCLTSESEAYQPLPNEDNSAVEEFRKAFSLERNDGETGTSFVIPFVSPELTEKSLLRAILTDFFFAIHNGRLEVTINSISVNQLNLRQHVEKELHDSDDLTIDYLDFLEDAITASTASTFNASDEWASGSELLEENFGADEIDLMRDAFLDGDPIGVRFPITVTLQSGEKRESYISVFVQAGDHIRKSVV